MKYDSILSENLKNLLPSAKSILIALPAGADIDRFAGGLALFLSLTQAGKEVSVVCEDTVRVAQSHLFGIDHVQRNLTTPGGGNYIITLEGVAVPDATDPRGGKVPALEKLDYLVNGKNLDLVFNVTPGQTFQPTQVIPHYQGSSFSIIFVIGAANLASLGSVYTQNQSAFSGVQVVNIDNQATNTSFGQTNVIDLAASSVSEMMTDIITGLSLSMDADIASNLLAGIFDATANLTDQKVNADTYLAIGNNMRAGGQKPQLTTQTDNSPKLDLSFFSTPPIPVMSQNPEVPVGETVTTAETVEPDPGWLTPKVFKGTSIG